MPKYRIRKASGATAVEVVWCENNTRKIAKHMGSAKDNDELRNTALFSKTLLWPCEPASAIASASLASVLFVFTNGFTYCGLINLISAPN